MKMKKINGYILVLLCLIGPLTFLAPLDTTPILNTFSDTTSIDNQAIGISSINTDAKISDYDSRGYLTDRYFFDVQYAIRRPAGYGNLD